MSRAAMIGYGPCFVCRESFTFNPNWVPSVPIDPRTGKPPDVDTADDGIEAATQRSTKVPVCSSCIEVVNRARVARGQQPIYVSPHAYEPTDSL